MMNSTKDAPPSSSSLHDQYGVAEESEETHTQALLHNLSVLEEKVRQVHSLVGSVVSPPPETDRTQQLQSSLSGAGTLIEEIIVAASSLLCSFQLQVAAAADPEISSRRVADETMDLQDEGGGGSRTVAVDIIELDAVDLLAKYTHYCQVCGKGFRRDANLRMHMRAHGDEYKTNAALTKSGKGGSSAARKYYYSCPVEGCRWNKKHAKFQQPLKSMICVKNHYRRSHCPKTYVCNRCGVKQFSVISDLRTHEKHCGDLKWRCSCGTNFSRKDKLMGHVALFVGHFPVPEPPPLPLPAASDMPGGADSPPTS